MDDRLYKHVLFKDLYPYLKKTDYLSGFSTTEQAYIRQNIGAIGQLEAAKLTKNGLEETDYDNIQKLIRLNGLHPGRIYVITDYQTIYQSPNKNQEGKYISWGLDINPSKIYSLITTAYNNNTLLPMAYIINDDSTCTLVNYNVNQQVLDDGVSTKGSISYMLDQNRNQANFDFKNQLIVKDKPYYLFSDINGNENSNNCYFNNCCRLSNTVFIGEIENTFIEGDNNFIKTSLKNVNGKLNNSVIALDEIGLSNETNKNIICLDGQYFIDYLDFETLTHQFYAIS